MLAHLKVSKKLEMRVLTALLIGPACLVIAYWGGPVFYLMLVICYGLSMREAMRLIRALKPRWLYLLGSFIYITGCFACFWLLLSYAPIYPFLLIVLVASSDIGAYAFGKVIGGPKMLVSVSPNKTWAGLFGACFAPMILYSLWSEFYQQAQSMVEYLEIAFFGAMIGVAGQTGDMLISYVKRKAGVKDSGALLPGHGGILDRIDALLLSAPVFLLAKVLGAGG